MNILRKAFKINKVVKYLIISDFLFLSAYGIISPFLTIYIVDRIDGGTIENAGFAVTIYLLLRGILQLPISLYIDKIKGDKDDYRFIVFGSVITTLSCFLLAISTNIEHVYAAQVLSAIGGAASYPAWYALFSKYIDPDNAAFEWTVYDTLISVGTAITAGLGGLLIAAIDYRITLLLVAIFSTIGAIFVMAIKGSLRSV